MAQAHLTSVHDQPVYYLTIRHFRAWVGQRSYLTVSSEYSSELSFDAGLGESLRFDGEQLFSGALTDNSEPRLRSSKVMNVPQTLDSRGAGVINPFDDDESESESRPTKWTGFTI